MLITLTFNSQAAIQAFLLTQTKLAQINATEAMRRTGDAVVAILREATPGGPDGPVASAWHHDDPVVKGSHVAVLIYNDAMTEDGKWPIATLLEYGTSPHLIRAINGKALAFPVRSSNAWEGGSKRNSSFADFERRNFSPVTGGYRPSHQSSARYGNSILSRGQYRPKVASDILSGLGQYRLTSGRMSRPRGAKDMIIVKEVHHPGTRPMFIVRNNLGRFQLEIDKQGRAALIALGNRQDLREA